MEDELDYILSQVDAHLFDHALTDIASSDSAVPSALPNGERFAFQSDESVEAAKTNSTPKNTSRNTNWAVNVWKDWSSHRRAAFPNSFQERPVHLVLTTNYQLDYGLSKFVVEARRSDGECYPPNTLYGICCGLLRYVRETRPAINFWKDGDFAGFRKTLDGEMKRLRSLGFGVKTKIAEPLSIKEENQL